MDVEAGGSYQNNNVNPNNQNPPPSQELPGGSKIRELQDDVNQLATVMKTNINKVLERGDRMDTLNERSELLSSRANEFRINSRSVRRKFWWQNMRFQMVLGVVMLSIVIVIIYSLSK